MIEEEVIEEHPHEEPAPWISNAVLAPKDDGSVRVTLDARNLNKAIQSTNRPIPRHEDIKSRLGGANLFSKMDFKSAFWQIELDEESRYLTVFHANDKLYRYKRLTMGLAPSQGELNTALQPIFSQIKCAHLIHDDLVIAASSEEEHEQAIEECMEAISQAGLTLNPKKCSFGMREISFWGMVFGADGIKPDPTKVEALEYITAPTSKEDLISFLCMMQSNADFIGNFAKKVAPLRELTKARTHFKWTDIHQLCFENIISDFKKETLLHYFELEKPIFIFADAHISGLGSILAQGDSIQTAIPIAFASRTTNAAERNYPQLDLEGMAVDFGLRRFRNYILGAPEAITVVTDHKPLCSIFNGNRKGSIRTEKIKMRHQDIHFTVQYQKGKLNQADFVSRRAKPWNKIPLNEQNELNDLNKLLFMLHTTPVIDHIGIDRIATETKKDAVLSKLSEIIQSGQDGIPRTSEPELRKFRQILSEISITSKGTLLKSDRIILPKSLQTMAIELAHRGSHSRQSGIEKRLRYHFFFHNMKEQVTEFMEKCLDCATFSEKKTQEPLKAHTVPEKCWDSVAVDLFGPMPSKNHVVVVQDLASRYPAAKLVSSTSASRVLPALSDIYDTYGNPSNQLSDNGAAPFNSNEMVKFADKRNINLQKIPPVHPVSNPAETFMKPLGKTMKIAHKNRSKESDALQQLLSNYRDTPHPATGLAPGAMIFRDGYQTVFPRVPATEQQVHQAKDKDKTMKEVRQDKINSSKFRQTTQIAIGDLVLMRNFNKSRKFDPVFGHDFHVVVDILTDSLITVMREKDGKLFKRHLDDIKLANRLETHLQVHNDVTEKSQVSQDM